MRFPEGLKNTPLANIFNYFNYLDLAENFAFFQPQDWPQQPPIVPLEENP